MKTACANYWVSVLPEYVNFNEKGKPKYPEKNPPSRGIINNGNSTHIKYHTRLIVSVAACIACATRASLKNL